MPDSTPNITAQLKRATPELRDYVRGLQAQEDTLLNITEFSDPGEAVEVLAALGEAIIRYAGSEDTIGHEAGDQKIDALAALFARLGEGIANQQRAAVQNMAA